MDYWEFYKHVPVQNKEVKKYSFISTTNTVKESLKTNPKFVKLEFLKEKNYYLSQNEYICFNYIFIFIPLLKNPW